MAIAVLPGSPVLGGVDKLVHRGTNGPRPIWRFGGLLVDGEPREMNLAGSTMVLSVRWDGGGFDTSSDPLDPNAALYGPLALLTRHDLDRTEPAPPDPRFRDVVRWHFTRAAADRMPLGRIARFRLDRQVRGKPGGEFRAYRTGFFIVRDV